MTNLKLTLQSIVISASLVSAIPASAQISMEAGGWSDAPLGFSRDTQANRIIIAGGGSGSSAATGSFGSTRAMMPSWSGTTTGGSATAIGNMISVEIEGNNNTVMVDASQINLGNQSAIVAHLPTSGGD
ncbi:hypothetical protein [Hyphomonas sp. UBA4494]|jgi:holdfast attachment protein HfaA|uniref:hypothetical protein n=1 Tax=Hyphomonas sp. UBA4494 TaxID=1946631 RepID=UPI0025C17B22|nr:hypothetical protein [Hyphomonas sp. UBA4494]